MQKSRWERSGRCTFADKDQHRQHPHSARRVGNIRGCTGAVQSWDTRVLHFIRIHESRSCLHTPKIEGQSRSRSPEERRACEFDSPMTRQLHRVHNECAIKDRWLYTSSLQANYRVAKMRKLVLRASRFISANTKVFSALLPVAQRSPDLCRSARSLAVAVGFVFPFPSFSHCTINDSMKISLVAEAIFRRLRLLTIDRARL